ncbi:polysaccharide biosynthesis protein [Mucilaginibacter jinjuensis]|uniref:Polysaccharide biosynthesis protein n=1 Tax=Mucilaginibacter jinjuensis TaxID=1176721 RepID=A0ABY7TBD9_9SPHI|nr:polysaccharide biosynthesis protein [Mucilaginibacter jinjuensis]WCT13829.1 polysaccharide biosynthesis protein [Mucilaginibacter jinjuensis]
MLGTMTVLADGGISAGVMSQGGEVWQDKDRLGAVMVTGLDLRRKFAIGSLLVALPILFYLLLHHGAGVLKAIIIVACLIPAFLAALSDSLLEISLKLHQDILPLQKNQVSVNLLRLLLILSIFLFPWTAIAILAASIPRTWGNYKLRKISTKHVNWNQKVDLKVRKRILSGVKRLLPESIYYCASGQITIWLISIFGTTSSIADVGALSRLTTVLSLLSILFSTLIYPRFARLANGKNLLIRYLQVQFGLILICIFVVAVVYLFSPQLLWIIGPKYSNLHTALVLSTIAACLGIMYGVSFSLCTVRGWAINPIIYIAMSVVVTAACAFLLDVSSLNGILLLNIITTAFQVLAIVTYTFVKIFKK